jgi:hypothetical protein
MPFERMPRWVRPNDAFLFVVGAADAMFAPVVGDFHLRSQVSATPAPICAPVMALLARNDKQRRAPSPVLPEDEVDWPKCCEEQCCASEQCCAVSKRRAFGRTSTLYASPAHSNGSYSDLSAWQAA